MIPCCPHSFAVGRSALLRVVFVVDDDEDAIGEDLCDGLLWGGERSNDTLDPLEEFRDCGSPAAATDAYD